MKKNQPKVVVVMPAYNAEKTLAKTYKDIPKDLVHEIILVDDGSHDQTVALSKTLGIKTYVHKHNKGYGANQKTCYKLALKLGADIVVMVHPDYQYDSALIGELIRPIVDQRFDLMLGSRIRTRKEAIAGGMPKYKYLGNRILTMIENIALGLNLSEYHTGFRAFSKEVLIKAPLNKFSDDFVFDQQILIWAIKKDFTVGEIPVLVRYFPDASSINFVRSTKYGIQTVIALFKLK